MSTSVRHDSFKGWLVVCAVHGQLASYKSFHVASRDARQHAQDCGDGASPQFSDYERNKRLVESGETYRGRAPSTWRRRR